MKIGSHNNAIIQLLCYYIMEDIHDIQCIIENESMSIAMIVKYIFDINNVRCALLLCLSRNKLIIIDAILEEWTRTGTLDGTIANTILTRASGIGRGRCNRDHRGDAIFHLAIKYNLDLRFDNDVLLRLNAKRCKSSVVKLLLENGASENIHFNDDEAFYLCSEHTASACPDLSTVKLLLDAGANVGARDNAAIKFSIKFSTTDMLKLLMEHGGQISCHDITTTLGNIEWFEDGHLEILKYLMALSIFDAKNSDYLLCAVECHYLELVQFLIDNGANVCANDNAALRLAINKANIDTIVLLLKCGADVNSINFGNTELFFEKIISNSNVDVINALIDYGVNIQIQNNFMIKCAVKYWRSDIVKRLIDHGLNIADCDADIINKINYMFG